MKHFINWVEIPVTDIKRAVDFYSAILQVELHEMEMAGNSYAIFPIEDTFNCGALVQGEHYKPSTEGTLIYLDGGGDLNNVLSKVNEAGGQVIMEKTFLSSEAGNVALLIDTEGNKIGLHSSAL